MPQVIKTKIVPFSCLQMFALVADVESYPQFLPWCSQAVIKEKTPSGVVATLTAVAGIGLEFTTRNRNYSPDRIEMELVGGVLEKLVGEWKFTALAEGCQVLFKVDFRLPKGLAMLSANFFLKQAMGSLVEAFSKRAQQVYKDLPTKNVPRDF